MFIILNKAISGRQGGDESTGTDEDSIDNIEEELCGQMADDQYDESVVKTEEGFANTPLTEQELIIEKIESFGAFIKKEGEPDKKLTYLNTNLHNTRSEMGNIKLETGSLCVKKKCLSRKKKGPTLVMS